MITNQVRDCTFIFQVIFCFPNYFRYPKIQFYSQGHGIDNAKIDEVKDGKAQTPTGECLVEYGIKLKLFSIHDLRTLLLRFNADRITLTLDCCRSDFRGNQTVTLQ